MTWNISKFLEWFISIFVNIGTALLNILQNFYIYNNVSMLDFVITIAIIGSFLTIIITTPTLGIVNRQLNAQDRKIRAEKRKKHDK